MEPYLKMFKICILITALTGNTVLSSCDYPNCNGAENSFCLYPATLDTSVQKCSKPEAKAGLNNDYKKSILDAHNRLRQRVAQGKQQGQPEAANMMKLVWNKECEEIAQRFVNECDKDGLAHDRCRDLKDGTKVGQNSASSNIKLQEGGNRTKTLYDMVQMWYDEVASMNPAIVEHYQFSSSTGHYTQLVWAESTRLGCGYREENKANDWFQPVCLKCNYAIAGNLQGASIYIKGKACSKCPKGTHCSKKYPGLCTDEKNEDKELGGQSDKRCFPNRTLVKLMILIILLIL